MANSTITTYNSKPYLSIQVRVVTGAVDRPWARPADVDGRSALFHVVGIFLDHKE